MALGAGAERSKVPSASATRRTAPVTTARATSLSVAPHARFTSTIAGIDSDDQANERRRPTDPRNGVDGPWRSVAASSTAPRGAVVVSDAASRAFVSTRRGSSTSADRPPSAPS